MVLNPSHISLRSLPSFGNVAAEDDAVLDYFLTTDAATRIAKNEVFLVLGRKGAGKTALVLEMIV
jgi:ABC-type multidrug transport system ATPase subunit